MQRRSVSTEVVRLVDRDVATGVWPDMIEQGWATDAWPAIQEKVWAANILVIAGPVWMGRPTRLSETRPGNGGYTSSLVRGRPPSIRVRAVPSGWMREMRA